MHLTDHSVFLNPAAPAVHRVFVLLFPGFVLLDATGPIQVFATTSQQCQDEHLAFHYEVRVVSASGGAVESAAGVSIMSEPLPELAQLRDATLLVPGTQDLAVLAREQALCAWLAAAHAQTRQTCSVCTGAFLLAEAGLLDGCRATTHWMDSRDLQRRYPAVEVDADAIYVRDGRLWTSAGVSAGIDLALALVEEDLGRALALRVAHRLVLYLKRPGGQRQYSAELHAQTREDSLGGRLSQWLLQRLDKTLGIDEMAEAMAISARTLHRQVLRETGLTPAELLKRLRLEAACRAMAKPELSLKQIASRSGFGDEYNMRRAFNQTLGIPPSEYRKRAGA